MTDKFIKDMVAATLARGGLTNPSDDLKEALENTLSGAFNQPWLGNATTRELIDELSSRIGLNTCNRLGCDRCGMDYKPTGPYCGENINGAH